MDRSNSTGQETRTVHMVEADIGDGAGPPLQQEFAVSEEETEDAPPRSQRKTGKSSSRTRKFSLSLDDPTALIESQGGVYVWA